MSELRLEDAQIRSGVWRGIIQGADAEPQIEIRHMDQPVDGVQVGESELGWVVECPIPPECISEGVQTFTVFDRTDGESLGKFTLIAGEALGDDIRAEIELLRAELDMLKRAFRRHCLETQ